MELVEVHHIEAAERHPIEEDRPHTVPLIGRPEEADDLRRRVPPVDPHCADPDPLQLVGGRDDDRRQRGVPLAAAERSIIHARDAEVRLRKGPPQG